jgi:hypothetical protein
LHYYHLAVRSEVYFRLSWPGDWLRQLASHLSARQQSDGRFINTRSPLMKEDDPQLCTSLAVIARADAATLNFARPVNGRNPATRHCKCLMPPKLPVSFWCIGEA